MSFKRQIARAWTRKSIESWFKNMPLNWEDNFSNQELKLGRNKYKNGDIVSIELSQNSAVISTNQDFYVVLDLENKQISYRTCIEKNLDTTSTAIAGMYFVEELLAENVEDTSPVFKQSKAVIEEKKTQEISTPTKEDKKEDFSYPIFLYFSCKKNALCFEIKFADFANNKNILSFSNKFKFTKSQREEIISIISSAQKEGFVLNEKTFFYEIEGTTNAQNFVRTRLSKWEDKFNVKYTDEVKLLANEAIEVEAKLNAIKDENENEFDLDFRLSVNDFNLNLTQTNHLLSSQSKRILIPEIGVVKLSFEKAKIIKNVKHLKSFNFSGTNKLPFYMLFSIFAQNNLPISMSKELANFKSEILQDKQNQKEKDLPKSLDFLRDYQKSGVKWILRNFDNSCHSLLADEMGLGKTLQALSVISIIIKKTNLPILVVCPASVISVWLLQIKDFFPKISAKVLNAQTKNEFAKCEENVLWLSSYTQLRSNKNLLENKNFELAILDEGQFVKNPDAQTSRAVFQIKANKRLILTGTPIENHPQDIWSLMRFLMPGLLGSKTQFDDIFAKKKEDILSLQKQLKPFILRRTKKAVAKELPDKVDMPLYCNLTESQKKYYIKIVEQMQADIGNNLENAIRQKSFSFLSYLTRLRQCACDPALLPWAKDEPFENSSKLINLGNKLDDIMPAKVVVFSQFVKFLDRTEDFIKIKFPKAKIFKLTGKTKNRGELVESFQKSKAPAIMLASLKAGGVGISLQSAEYLFLMDPWWNPASEEQAVDRIHRIGQKKSVFIYRLISSYTIEEKVQILKANKKTLFDNLLSSMKDISDLKEYFSSIKELISLKK